MSVVFFDYLDYVYERFEPRNHFKSRLSLIVRVNAVLNGTDVVDSRVYSALIVVNRQP